MSDRPLTELVTKFLEEHRGFVLESDVIDAIAVLALMGDGPHLKGYCTETNKDADVYCGARSLVSHAMAKAHPRG